MAQTLRIAYFSPLAPLRCSVSDHSEELLPHLCQRAEVDVYTDDRIAAVQEIGRIYPLYGYGDLTHPERYDYLLFQLANEASAAPVYRCFRYHGGVVALHDLDLPAIDGLKPANGTNGGLCRRGWLGRGRPEVVPQPAALAVAQRATGIIVHSRRARDSLLMRNDRVPVWHVPLGVRRAPNIDPHEARTTLQLPADAFICLFVGRLDSNRRLHMVLQTLARLRERVPHCLYLLLGAAATGYNLHEVAHELGVSVQVRLVEGVDLSTLYRYLAAADVGLVLDGADSHEAAANLLRTMSSGRAVVVSNMGSSAELPDHCVLKIDPGPGEVAQLTAALWALANHRPMREWYGQQAAHHVQTNHTLTAAAHLYIQALEELSAEVAPTMAASPA